MEDLKSQFIQATKDGRKQDKQKLDQQEIEQLTNKFLQFLLHIISISDKTEITIDLAQFAYAHIPVKTKFGEMTDCKAYTKAIYQRISKHSDVFKPLELKNVTNYLNSLGYDTKDFAESVVTASDAEHKDAVEQLQKLIKNIKSPDHITCALINKQNNKYEIYFNWQGFQESAVDEYLN